MRSDQQHRRWRWGAALLLVLALSCGGGLTVAIHQAYRAAEYPGATLVADHTLTRYTPNFVLRRDTVYRSADSFNRIYNWYSVKFTLGPETYAQSNCILMAKSVTTGWILEEQMSVTVCSTPNDRMMFVMRSVMFRYLH